MEAVQERLVVETEGERERNCQAHVILDEVDPPRIQVPQVGLIHHRLWVYDRVRDWTSTTETNSKAKEGLMHVGSYIGVGWEIEIPTRTMLWVLE